jgi:hypothetical protein
MVSGGRNSLRDALTHLALSTAVRGADLMLQFPALRDFFLERLLRRLEDSYSQCQTDSDRLMHDRWLGPHLRAFLDRLIAERPSAARAILRFIATWCFDMYRRTESQRVGLPYPCTVVIDPTDRCNLNCPGCYAKSTSDGSDLPYRRIAKVRTCRPAKNMPPGYLDGEIGRAVQSIAQEWRDYAAHLPPLPAEIEAARRPGRPKTVATPA